MARCAEGRGRDAGTGATLAQNAGRFGVPLERAHHARWDAFVTAQLFMVAASRLEGHGVSRLGALLRSGQRRLRR